MGPALAWGEGRRSRARRRLPVGAGGTIRTFLEHSWRRGREVAELGKRRGEERSRSVGLCRQGGARLPPLPLSLPLGACSGCRSIRTYSPVGSAGAKAPRHLTLSSGLCCGPSAPEAPVQTQSQRAEREGELWAPRGSREVCLDEPGSPSLGLLQSLCLGTAEQGDSPGWLSVRVLSTRTGSLSLGFRQPSRWDLRAERWGPPPKAATCPTGFSVLRDASQTHPAAAPREQERERGFPAPSRAWLSGGSLRG